MVFLLYSRHLFLVVDILAKVRKLIRGNFTVIRKRGQKKAPNDSDQIDTHFTLENTVQCFVSLRGCVVFTLHFQTGRFYEIDCFKAKFSFVCVCASKVVFGLANIPQGLFEIAHSEMGCCQSAQTVNPSTVQIDSVTEPNQSAIVLFEFFVSVCEAVNKDQICGIFPQSLLEVVHCCLNIPAITL